MPTFPEARKRLLDNIFVCKKCKSKIRTSNLRVQEGDVKCRKCGSKDLRKKRTLQ